MKYAIEHISFKLKLSFKFQCTHEASQNIFHWFIFQYFVVKHKMAAKPYSKEGKQSYLAG